MQVLIWAQNVCLKLREHFTSWQRILQLIFEKSQFSRIEMYYPPGEIGCNGRLSDELSSLQSKKSVQISIYFVCLLSTFSDQQRTSWETCDCCVLRANSAILLVLSSIFQGQAEIAPKMSYTLDNACSMELLDFCWWHLAGWILTKVFCELLHDVRW